MKREDVKKKIPGITDEQLDWLMSENGADINREKTAAAAVQAELKIAEGNGTTLYMMVAETTAEESRNAANKKEEPDRKVRQELLLAQEAAFPDSSELNILEYTALSTTTRTLRSTLRMRWRTKRKV